LSVHLPLDLKGQLADVKVVEESVTSDYDNIVLFDWQFDCDGRLRIIPLVKFCPCQLKREVETVLLLSEFVD
jgi:hypothetical protein